MITPYNIVTEFRFDIAHAVADSKTLQNSVGAISDTANQTLINLKRVGVGVAAQMGIFSGGFLGFMYNAIQSSEKFASSQRNLANILFTNKDNMHMAGLSFQESMKMSAKLMDTIGKKGMEFGIDPSMMLSQTKAIAPMLLSHGLDGPTLHNSIDISRGLMKSAPTLGVDPNLVQGQLTNLVSGRASLSDTLFQRLMSETSSFRDAKITNSQSFNSMDAHKRIELVRKALLQFGSTAEVIEGNVNSLNGMMTKFMSMVKGEFSILKPLGDVLMVPIRKAFQFLNSWMNNQGRAIIQNISSVIGDFIEDPIKAYVKLRQISRLKTDLSFAGKIAGMIGIFEGLRHVLGLFGIRMMGFGTFFRTAMGYIWQGMRWIFAVAPWGKIFGFVFRMIGTAISQVVRILAPILFFLQIWSRTLAKLEVIWATWMAANAGKMTETVKRIWEAIGNIMLPIEMAIEGVSDILAGILGWFVTKEIVLTFFEMLASSLELVADIIVHALSAISGLGAAIGQMITDIMDFRLKGIGGRMKTAFEEGTWDFYKKAYKIKDSAEDPSVSGKVTNINNLNINQSIKEQVEPDRIAFAAVSAFKKIAQNPTQASGSRLKAGMAQ